MHPIEGRVPSRATWEDLQRFLAWLPTAVADQRPAEVRLVGGAHLSVAVAFGAALPETAGMPLSAPERWRSRPPGELEGRWYLTTKTMATLMTPSSLITGPRTTLPAP